MPNKGNPGMNALANVLCGRMRLEGQSPLFLDLGTIGGDMSLTTDTFPKSIPRSDYLVCRMAQLGSAGSEFAATQEGDSVRMPELLKSISAGDRVLVAWVGHEAVVIDRVAVMEV